MIPYGTFVNMLAVLLGGGLGLMLGQRFPESIKRITFHAIGLATLAIGAKMALAGQELILLIFSLIVGGIVGELLALDAKTAQLGEWLKHRLRMGHERFSEGLTTTFLIFCVGSMTMLGAIEEGLGNTPTLLFTKSVLDGFTAIALATIYGSSVLFSVLPMLLFQGGLTLLAAQAQQVFDPYVVQEMGAVGGVMILGIGLNILEIKSIKVINLLPALGAIVLFLMLKPWVLAWF
jgi:hypothetical protein